jgi:hypothetical protein
MDEVEDFGFTTDDVVDFEEPSEGHVQDLKALEGLILPLLLNLQKNPEQPIIKWPNRKEVLSAKMEEILKITRKYDKRSEDK